MDGFSTAESVRFVWTKCFFTGTVCYACFVDRFALERVMRGASYLAPNQRLSPMLVASPAGLGGQNTALSEPVRGRGQFCYTQYNIH